MSYQNGIEKNGMLLNKKEFGIIMFARIKAHKFQ